jgi:LysR family transcriptional regulator (chromosome initiation inhibitor)
MQFDYKHLRALSAVLATGSFEQAAARLAVTPSAISQRIKVLEESVGARLVLRESPCTGTDMGLRLARHAESVALLEAQLLDGAASVQAPSVAIAVNADSLDTWLMTALAQVPQTRFEITLDDQDHSTELLKQGRVAAAITARAAPVQGCDSVALGGLRYVATASPDFRDRWFARGVTRGSLEAAPALIFNQKDALQTTWAARECGAAVHLSGHIIPSTHGFVGAACSGLGWGLNPEALVAEHLAKGTLVALGQRPMLDTPLFWQVSRHVAGPLEPLTRAIRTAARASLVQ